MNTCFQENYIDVLVNIISELAGMPIEKHRVEMFITANYKYLLQDIKKGDYHKIATKYHNRGVDLGKSVGIL